MHTTNDILKGLREAGLSQDEIARRAQISQPTLSRWVTRGPAKGADAVLRLAELLRTVHAGQTLNDVKTDAAGGSVNA